MDGTDPRDGRRSLFDMDEATNSIRSVCPMQRLQQRANNVRAFSFFSPPSLYREQCTVVPSFFQNEQVIVGFQTVSKVPS